MRIAVATLRRPKLEGVRRALERLRRLPWPNDEVEIMPFEVESGEPDTPLSDTATLRGARRRARTVLEQHPDADLGLGLEGGVDEIPGQPPAAVLRNWAVAWDGTREGVGSGPGILLPPVLSEAVLGGGDLAAAIDRLAGERDIRSRQGTFGVLTADLIDPTEAFALAVTAALCPWYEPAWWSA